jgi:hypothetical protein
VTLPVIPTLNHSAFERAQFKDFISKICWSLVTFIACPTKFCTRFVWSPAHPSYRYPSQDSSISSAPRLPGSSCGCPIYIPVSYSGRGMRSKYSRHHLEIEGQKRYRNATTIRLTCRPHHVTHVTLLSIISKLGDIYYIIIYHWSLHPPKGVARIHIYKTKLVFCKAPPRAFCVEARVIGTGTGPTPL